MQEKTKNIKKEIITFLRDTAIWCGIMLVLCNLIIMPATVRGVSMRPTLENGEFGLGSRIGILFSGINRFDIVEVYKPTEEKYIIKRVIGLPGDVVQSIDDVLYINGEAVEQPFLKTDYAMNTDHFTDDFGPVTVGEGEYFCMGDNRPDSHDSRIDGAYPKEYIKAKHFFVITPFDRFGLK